MWVPEGGWGWGGGLGERVRSMGPSWTRGERRWENTEDGETQKRLRQGEGRRGGKGERCGETFALGLQEVFIKPQKWVGNRRADRRRDETEGLETDTAREQEAARDPPTKDVACSTGCRQSQGCSETRGKTGTEAKGHLGGHRGGGKKAPQGRDPFSFLSPGVQGRHRWDAGRNRGSGRGRDPAGGVDPSPSHPPAPWVGQRPPPRGGAWWQRGQRRGAGRGS